MCAPVPEPLQREEVQAGWAWGAGGEQTGSTALHISTAWRFCEYMHTWASIFMNMWRELEKSYVRCYARTSVPGRLFWRGHHKNNWSQVQKHQVIKVQWEKNEDLVDLYTPCPNDTNEMINTLHNMRLASDNIKFKLWGLTFLSLSVIM